MKTFGPSDFSLSFHPLCAKSLQLCPTLCDPMDYSLPGSSVHRNLQARIPQWLPFPSPGDFPNPGIEPASLISPTLAGRCSYQEQHLGSPFTPK